MYYYQKCPKDGCRIIAHDVFLIPNLLASREKCSCADLNDVFAVDATVTEISDCVTVRGCNGVSWAFPVEEAFGCDPFVVGAAVTMLMWQKPNTSIQDSTILDIYYDHGA